MTNKYELKNKLLIKMGRLVSAFLIIFLLGIVKVDAFKYSDFDFEEFKEQTKNYWSSYCPNKDDKCADRIIESQKKFYKKLYKLLAKYEKKGLIIDDSIIIETVFFEYSPSSFNDTSGSYNLDPKDVDDCESCSIEEHDSGSASDKEYWENETDTIKLLLKNMVGYERRCYGISNPRVEYETTQDEEGNKTTKEYYVCDNGSLDANNRCLKEIKNEVVNFFEKYADKFQSFFGIKSKSSKDCDALAKEQGYISGEQPPASTVKRVSEEAYWQFLTESKYFDNKPNLYHRYLGVLQKAKTKKISDLYGNEEYEKELVKVRTRIVDRIKEIVDKYRKLRPESAYIDASNKLLWWPIGSAETEEVNGVLFASGNPVSTTITSSFGPRIDPVDKETQKNHHGIDIGNLGGNGETNVIAAQSGVVITVNNNCKSGGDEDCGGKYGNYIQIEHANGIYTLYAHLHEGTITVKKGETVSQGQVIAKAGSSGKSTGTHLHFEVRVGSSNDYAVDPLEYVSPDNPRPKNSGVTFVDGGEAMKTVCLSLKASGFADTGVAALLTNIQAESSFNYNSIGDGNTSYGLCQWHESRWNNLKNFTSEWQTVEGQLQFLLHELETGEGGTDINAYRNGNGTAEELASKFCIEFERPQYMDTVCPGRASDYAASMLNYVKNGCN